MTTQFRVAVVGAGPAGSTAARLLAARGADVALFEARRLPRPKLCGGGLTPKAQRLVPPETLEAIERRSEWSCGRSTLHRIPNVYVLSPGLSDFRVGLMVSAEDWPMLSPRPKGAI